MSMKIHYGIYRNNSAFCYLSQIGKVTCWGDSNGGHCTHLANDLSKNIVKIAVNKQGFCALRKDGKVFSWGHGHNYYDTNEENANYIDIFSGEAMFAGIKKDGRLIAWGSGYLYDNWNTEFLKDRNKVIKAIYWRNGFIGLKLDGTLCYIGRAHEYSAQNEINIYKSSLTNIKDVYTTTSGVLCIKHDNSIFSFGNIVNITTATHGLKGRNGEVGDPKILNTGEKEIYTTSDKFIIYKKDDKSVHIIGNLNDNQIKQYKKLDSNVKFVWVDNKNNSIICIKEDNTAVMLGLDPVSIINKQLVNIDKIIDRFWVLDISGKAICLRPDIFDVQTGNDDKKQTYHEVKSQLETDVVHIEHSYHYRGNSYLGCFALKKDGSVVRFGNDYYKWWNFVPRNHDNVEDATLFDSGVVALYHNMYRQLVYIKDDGKLYTFGNYNDVMLANTNLIDISSSEYAGRNNGYKSNYSDQSYHHPYRTSKPNLYEEITTTSLNKSKYNSNAYSISNTFNTFTIFEPDLNTNGANGNIYLYNDETGKGIVEDSLGNDIVFTLNNGLSSQKLQTILNHDLTQTNTYNFLTSNYSNSYNFQSQQYNHDVKQKRLQMIRTLFQNNYSVKHFFSTKNSLGFNLLTETIDKDNFKVMHTLNNTELTYDFPNDTDITSNRTFYILMEEKSKSNIILEITNTITIECTDTDTNGNQIYFISSSKEKDGVILKYTSSNTYIRNSYPLGPFKDGDKIIFEKLNIVLSGGVIENSNTTDSSNYPILTYKNYVPALEPKIPIFPGKNGYLGIADNGYLYSWGDMDDSGRLISGAKDENGDWTNSTQNRITDISQVSIGYNDYFAILLKNGKLSNEHYNYPALDHEKNIWYDNGVKKNDLSELDDIVEMYNLPYYQYNTGKESGASQALLLRQDGSVAVWSSVYDLNENSTSSPISAAGQENSTPNSSFARRLMDSTDPNFSRIKKICVGSQGGFLMLREDGRIAIFDKYSSVQRRLNIYPHWNRRGSVDYRHTAFPPYLPFTLGNKTGTLNNITRDYRSYYGNIIDIGIWGYKKTNSGARWWALNDAGQFFVFAEYYPTTNQPMSWYPPMEITFGDPTLQNPTKGAYFKKTIKVYSSTDLTDGGPFGWLIIFEDGTALTSFSEYKTTRNVYTDLFSLRTWNYDTNNPDVKFFDENDPISIKKYYTTYVELTNGYLRNIVYVNSSGYYNSNYRSTSKYYNWNHHEYGIRGTKYGYSADEPPYGDISGVKQLEHVSHCTICVKTNGELLVWGYDNYVGATGSGTYANTGITNELRNKFTNVKKIVTNSFAVAALRNDGSVFCWGHASYGGDITNTVPLASEGISNFTLDEGVIDIFASYYTFTAVKSDGIITWGNTSRLNPSDILDGLKNINWSAKLDGYSYLNYKNSWIDTYGFQSYNHQNTRDYPMYKTNSTLNNAITTLKNLLNNNEKKEFVENLVYYPKNIASFESLKLPNEFYKGVTKDDVRSALLNVLFNISPKINEFETTPEFLAFDGKINSTKLRVIKPNTGIINLSDFTGESLGFYIPMVNNDSAIFQSADRTITYKLTNNNDSYLFTKISGVDLSSNKTPPFSGKTEINNFIFSFKNGIFSGKDSLTQKYNCISTSQTSFAYLTNSGNVVTWGRSATGGFSHDQYGMTAPSTSYDIMEPNEDLLSDVVDIQGNTWGFVALKKDGTVITWGAKYATHTITSSILYVPYYTLTKKNTRAVFTNSAGAIAAILYDDTVVTWGRSDGKSMAFLGEPLTNMKTIIPASRGFMGIKNNGDLVTWGHHYICLFDWQVGVYSTNWKTVNNVSSQKKKLTNIIECYSTVHTFAALDVNGHITSWGYSQMGVMPSSLKNLFNSRSYVNIMTTQTGFAAIDTNGGVIAWGTSHMYTDTGGQWRDVSGEVSANITRISASSYDFWCLRNDNVAIAIRGSNYAYMGGDLSNNIYNTNSSYKIYEPPSQYIIGRYKLKDIRDIFSSHIGFAAITVDYNVICWGHRESYYITDIDYSKTHGGDLSGNEEDGNRPIAIFSNGRAWACLKEDETVVTWEGTGTYSRGTYASKIGANYNDPTYGINSEYWGGKDRTTGGAVRNGDGTETTLRNVKNIIPFSDNNNSRGGFVAICEDQSGNQYTVCWGGGHDDTRWKYSTPNSNGRGFRHIVEHLNDHSKIQIGIKNNYGVNASPNHCGFQISQQENIHEYNFGDRKFTGIPTGFGAPLQTVEIINTDEVIDDILKDISNSNIDICSNFIEEAQKEENKLSEDVDEDEKMSEETVAEESKKIAKVISIGETLLTNPKELRKQRSLRTKLVFSLNPKRNKFVMYSRDLGITSKFARGKTAIFKVNFGKAEVNLKEDPNVDDNTGFYIATEPGDEITMTNRAGNGKFKITQSEEKFDPDDDESSYKYFVELVDGTHPITLFRSLDYVVGSSPMGPFRDGDRARILGTDIEFGSITEGSPNYSFGDPYINPICGYPTKLPDENAIYRMVEGFGNMFINASVSKLNKSKQQKMKEWFYNKSGYEADKLGFITNGYYYNQFYISSENHVLFCDLDKECININSNELNYFSIKNNYEYDKQNPICSNEKCNKYTISWNHKNMGNIIFTLRIYENPQIDNGISIDIQNNAQKCIGLLINNYKPHLMKLENIKQNKNKKLRRKLRRTKNKFSIKNLTSKNEYWFNVKK